MKRILFIDDNPEVLRGLRRALATTHHEWGVEFAMSGEEALNLMSKSLFDVVVSDMRMPKMNGVELLNTVMERYPNTVRFILSGHSDREMIMNSLNCTHQFLAKPCNPETIRYTIERACKLQDLLKNETLKKIVTGIKDLPSCPTFYSLIIKEMQTPDASLKKVGYIISQDVSMSAKVLQLVNSAFFGLPQNITDPQQAAVFLGIDTLKALVLSVDVFSSFTEDAESCGFSLAEMWRHSLMTGRLARDIARAEMADGKAVEEALIAGILHDMGKLILLKVPGQYKKVMAFIEKTGCEPVEAEYAVMKTSHAELGAYLLGLWGIPDSIVETIAFHHNPSKLLEDMFIMPSESSNKDVNKIKTNDGNLKSLSVEKHLTGLTMLTAVHVANALMMQKERSQEITILPYVDIRYLSKLNLKDKLPEWVELYNKVTQEEVKDE